MMAKRIAHPFRAERAPKLDLPATMAAAMRVAAAVRELVAAVLALIVAIKAPGPALTAGQLAAVKKALKAGALGGLSSST